MHLPERSVIAVAEAREATSYCRCCEAELIQTAEQYIADKYGLTDGNTYRRIEPFDENLYWKRKTHKQVNIAVQLVVALM